MKSVSCSFDISGYMPLNTSSPHAPQYIKFAHCSSSNIKLSPHESKLCWLLEIKSFIELKVWLL